jgi:hypothetical protein
MSRLIVVDGLGISIHIVIRQILPCRDIFIILVSLIIIIPCIIGVICPGPPSRIRPSASTVAILHGIIVPTGVSIPWVVLLIFLGSIMVPPHPIITNAPWVLPQVSIAITVNKFPYEIIRIVVIVHRATPMVSIPRMLISEIVIVRGAIVFWLVNI